MKPCVEPPPVHNGCLQSLALVESIERLGETGSGREGQKMDTCSMVLHRRCIGADAEEPCRSSGTLGQCCRKEAVRQQGACPSRA
jgi:hypothetical protein